MDVCKASKAAIIAEQQCRGDDDHRGGGSFHAHSQTADDVGGGASEGGLGDGLHGAVAALSVVLRDPDEEERRDQADNPAEEQPAGMNDGAFHSAEHGVDGPGEARKRECRSDVEATIEGAHRVFCVVGLDDGDADDRGDEVNGVDDQREENALDAEDGVEGGSKNHGSDVFSSGRLEDVSSTTGTIAYIVAD